MDDFKIGDLVRCEDDSELRIPGSIKKGSHYFVDDVDDVVSASVRIGQGWFHKTRFVLADQPAGSTSEPTHEAPDAVFRPGHYAQFVIEPITFINANGLGFNIGNVIKYACRYNMKNGLEDLRKARRYLDIQIECMEREERVKAGEDPKDVWKETL